MIEICLPVKDEEQILASNIERLLEYLKTAQLPDSWQVVILVNGSKDASMQIARQLAAQHQQVRAVEVVEGGKGLALRSYFCTSQAETFMFMDIDLAVSLEALPVLLQAIYLEQCDLAMASRLLKQSKTERSWWRSLSSQIYNLLSRLVLGHKFRDLQCGFKAVRRSVFTRVSRHLKDDAWFFDTELVVACWRAGYKVMELPVDWRENRYDERRSKVHVLHDAFSFAVNLMRLRRRLKDVIRQ